MSEWRVIPGQRGVADVWRVARTIADGNELLRAPSGAIAFFRNRDRAVYAAHVRNNAEKRRPTR